MFHDFHNLRLATGAFQWDNRAMTLTSLPQSHEQRKVEKLLIKLAGVKAISAKPPQSVPGRTPVRVSGTANSRVFYST
jgi:hypothetical protein